VKNKQNKVGVVFDPKTNKLLGGQLYSRHGVSHHTPKFTAFGPAKVRAKKEKCIFGEVTYVTARCGDGIYRTFDGNGELIDHWTEQVD